MELGVAPSTIVLAVVMVGVLAWLAVTQHRLARFRMDLARLTPRGLDGLEQRVEQTGGELRVALSRTDELGRRCDVLQAQLQTSLQHIGIVRFNPFHDTGGDQSFAIALLDHEANGIVLSSLHNRTETRVFAKPVQAGDSLYALSGEEEQAIAQAIRQLSPGEDARRLKEPRRDRS